MFSNLRHPIRLRMKKRLPDGEGGFEEKKTGEVLTWAAITPLPPSKTEPATGPRFDVTIRNRRDLSDIHSLIWGKRGLLPLTQPYPLEKHSGYLRFQARVYLQEEPDNG